MIARSEFLAIGVLGLMTKSLPRRSASATSGCDHIDWVAGCLQRMETIKPNMTRTQLLSVFKTEGGLSTRLRRTYVSQDCPYFKVDVEFKAVGIANGQAGKPVGIEESSLDVIVGISKPYMQFTIAQ